MRNIDCFKLTICPYTPEFNPVERFFNTIKRRTEDGLYRYSLIEITEIIVWNINKIPKNTFKSYFQLSITEMAEHIITFSKLKDENIVKPKDKLDWIPKDNRIDPYKI